MWKEDKNAPGAVSQEAPWELSLGDSILLRYLRAGKSYEDIAGLLGKSIPRIHWWITELYQKLHINNRYQAAELFQPLPPLSALVYDQIARIYQLTGREKSVFVCLLTRPDLGRKGIAKQCGIADATVRNHLNSLYRKLQVHNRIDLIARVTEILGGGSQQPQVENRNTHEHAI